MFSIHNISLGSEKILLPISLRSFCCITSAIYISVKARNSKGDNDSICLFSKSGIEDNASMYALLSIPSSVLPPSGQTKSIIRRKTSLAGFPIISPRLNLYAVAEILPPAKPLIMLTNFAVLFRAEPKRIVAFFEPPADFLTYDEIALCSLPVLFPPLFM